MQGKYYVYTLAYPDGTVFYVGKGQGKRIEAHEREARQGKKSHKCNTIRKIWTNGDQVLRTVLGYFEMECDAFQYEIALIFFLDGLTNASTGGEGASGVLKSDKTRQKLRIANTGKSSPLKGKPGIIPSEETRRKIGLSGKGRTPHNKGKSGPTPSEELRKKYSEAQKNSTAAAEARRKLHESHKGRKRPEGTGQRISEGKKKSTYVHSEETICKIKETKRKNREAKAASSQNVFQATLINW